MSSLVVTPLAAGFLAIFYVLLSMRVVRFRRRDSVGIGHGDSHDLRRAIRVHANFAEYIPLGLLLLVLLEMSAMLPLWSLWVLGGALVLSRILHALGMSKSAGMSSGRFLGTLMIFTYMSVAGGALVFVGVHNAFVG